MRDYTIAVIGYSLGILVCVSALHLYPDKICKPLVEVVDNG